MKMYKVIEDGIEYFVKNYSNGDKYWFSNSSLQRFEDSNGYKTWYKNGKLHKENGPARIFLGGTDEYWLNNVYYPEITSDEEWEKLVLIANIIL